MTQRTSLDGIWQLTFGPQQTGDPGTPLPDWKTIPAVVPGNVELDLQRAGLLPELSVGNNIYLLREYETFEWWYRREFISPEIKPGQTADLIFDGLDCIADIWLNGTRIGHTANMLIAHRLNITDVLRPKGTQNELVIRIKSAVLEGRKYTPQPLNFAFTPNWESLNIRKAPHMYGWDIMPRVVSAGIWRSVAIEVTEPTHWVSVYWTTLSVNAAARTATVLVDWEFKTDLRSVDDLTVRVALANTVKMFSVVGTHGRARLELSDVDLWWPRGYGSAALYDATLELLDPHVAILDSHRVRLGIRTATLRYTDVTIPDEPGEFVFIVNGEKIFVKGTNWVPLDAFHSRDIQHLDHAMDMIADLNCNMIRCWGGNVYEHDRFFDRCDELGVMVWQDFAMACAIYPQDDEFAAAMRTEVECVVTRLRNHPCLVLWAGNNEIDETYAWAGFNVDPNTDRLSRDVLPRVVRSLDPNRAYLPSSPYRSPAYMVKQMEVDSLPEPYNAQPEQHLWGPRDDFKGAFYTSSLAHFASEIGYHGCPDRRSLEQFLDAGSVWPWQGNDQWLTHATRPLPQVVDFNYRIALMAKQISVLFDEAPDNLDDYILASQISQAEAKKFFIEWFRQSKWRKTGILWWNLRDGWPIISDAIVDYYNRKKLAYEYIKRVQTDLCVIVGEPQDDSHALLVVNDSRSPAVGTVRISDVDSGRILHEGAFCVDANSVATVVKLPVVIASSMWVIESCIDKHMPMQNHYLTGKRPYKLADYRRWLRSLGLPTGIGPEM